MLIGGRCLSRIGPKSGDEEAMSSVCIQRVAKCCAVFSAEVERSYYFDILDSHGGNRVVCKAETWGAGRLSNAYSMCRKEDEYRLKAARSAGIATCQVSIVCVMLQVRGVDFLVERRVRLASYRGRELSIVATTWFAPSECGNGRSREDEVCLKTGPAASQGSNRSPVPRVLIQMAGRLSLFRVFNEVTKRSSPVK